MARLVALPNDSVRTASWWHCAGLRQLLDALFAHESECVLTAVLQHLLDTGASDLRRAAIRLGKAWSPAGQWGAPDIKLLDAGRCSLLVACGGLCCFVGPLVMGWPVLVVAGLCRQSFSRAERAFA